MRKSPRTARSRSTISRCRRPRPTRLKLQLLFGHLQMLRQQAIADAGPDPEYKSIKLTATPDIQRLSGELLNDIPPLQPYRESFGNVQAERH